jgi:hypothetical protein
MIQGLMSVLRLLSWVVFLVRVSYAAAMWLRKIVRDAFSKPGDDSDLDFPDRPSWPAPDDTYTGD